MGFGLAVELFLYIHINHSKLHFHPFERETPFFAALPHVAHWKVDLKHGDALTVEFMKTANVVVNCSVFNEKLWLRISGSVYNVPKDFEILKERIVEIVTKLNKLA